MREPAECLVPRVGYHLTSRACWESIQADGEMREYLLRKPEIEALLHTSKGIFIFDGPYEGRLDELGSVLFQVQDKRSWEIVCLAVRYDRDDIKIPLVFSWNGKYGPDRLDLEHHGDLSSSTSVHPAPWLYHEHKRMWVLHGPIPIDRVTCVAEYDLNDLARLT